MGQQAITTNESELQKWTETIIEAFFLQLSVFGNTPEMQSAQAQQELDYAEQLIQKIQNKIESQQSELELFETLGGQIDTLVE